MKKFNQFAFGILTMLFLLVLTNVSAQKATISGKVIDKETGEGLIGVTVSISNAAGIAGGANTDFDGNYVAQVEPGVYTVTIKYISYNNFVVENFEAKGGVVNQLDAPMEIAGTSITEIVITATQVKNTDASLISLQRKSFAIQDGISSQQISRTGASNAASAMKQVTGAVVEGGKFIVMRGLGDRYSVSQLNGITMPSTDPYRNSSSLDLIPSQMIDNIITLKTFTPDLPGNFSGGLVNITTKSIPEKFNLYVGVSAGFNTQSSLIDNFLGHGSDAGSRDWLGYDDGGRALPEYLKDPAIQSQLSQSSWIDARNASENFNGLRDLINRSSRDLTNVFVPTAKSSPINHSFNFNIGNRFKLFGKDLGISLGGNFSRRFEYYDNGAVNTFINNSSPTLFAYQNLNETKSTESPHLGGLFSLNYKLDLNNSIGANVIYNNDADVIGRQQIGNFVGQLSVPTADYLTNSMEFIQREYTSYQFTGRHLIPKLNDVEITWAGSFNNSSQLEPDTRYFAYTRYFDESNGELRYDINEAEFRPPFHFWRELQDNSVEAKIDLSIPFLRKGREGSSNQIKIGGLFSRTERSFSEYQYLHNRPTNINSAYLFNNFKGDTDAFLDYSNFGIVDTLYRPDGSIQRYDVAYYYINQVNNKNFYDGSQEIAAAYAMAVYNFTPKLKAIGGVRMETTDLFVESRDTSLNPSSLKLTDFLPSLNLIYSLTERTNIRVAYSRTLARPNMRELAPFEQFDTKNGFFNLGNPRLQRTLIDNYDIRYEFFPEPGEILAISAFYKRFKNPILRAFTPTATIPELSYINIDEARVLGVELEYRKNLGFIGGKFMKSMNIGANLAFINSEYNIPTAEVEQAQNIDPSYDQTTRPFQGQAPYIANVILTYLNPDNGWESTLSFNISGRRLFNIGLFATPDVFEEAVPLLNFNLTKRFANHYQIGFSAENILNPDIRKTQILRDQEYLTEGFKIGTTFNLSFAYFIR